MKKKWCALLAGVLVMSCLTGCGASKAKEDSSDETVIRVAASATPHAEILEYAKTLLSDKGYDLEITIFDDYVQPNQVVESGDFNANFFQHTPYMESFNEDKGTHLVVAGEIHFEPLGIYPGEKNDLKDLASGDTIAVPNDTTNEARALMLLQQEGIIKLREGAGLQATVNDIEENPYGVKIIELEAAQIARVVDETSFVVLNGNYALNAGYTVKEHAIACEAVDSEAAKTYVNIIAVKEGKESSEGIQALVEVLTSKEVQNFIEQTYNGAVIPFVS
jgi:D-methionine transport system substrate-binding protein